jgi:hypothetical protein
MDALKWTTQLDEDLFILSETSDCGNDGVLVELVKIQRIVDRLGDRASPVPTLGMNELIQLQDMRARVSANPNVSSAD